MPTDVNMSGSIVTTNVINGIVNGNPHTTVHIHNNVSRDSSNQTTAAQPLQATASQVQVSGGVAAPGSDNGEEDDQPPFPASPVSFDNLGRIIIPTDLLKHEKGANNFNHAQKYMDYFPYLSGDKDLIQKVERGDKIVWNADQVKTFRGILQRLWSDIRKEGKKTFDDGIVNEYSKMGFRKKGSCVSVKTVAHCIALMSDPTVRAYTHEMLGDPFLILKINHRCVHKQGGYGSQFYAASLPAAIKELGARYSPPFTFEENVSNPRNQNGTVRHTFLSIGAGGIRDMKRTFQKWEQDSFGWTVRTQTSGSQNDGSVKIEVDATLDDGGEGGMMTVLVNKPTAERIVNALGEVTEDNIRKFFFKRNVLQRKVAELTQAAVTSGVALGELMKMVQEAMVVTEKTDLFCRKKTIGAGDVTMEPLMQEPTNQFVPPAQELTLGGSYDSPGWQLPGSGWSPLSYGIVQQQPQIFLDQSQQRQMQQQLGLIPIINTPQKHQHQTQHGGQPRQRGGQLSCPLDPQQMLQDQAVLQQTHGLSSSGQPGGSLPVIAHQQEQVPASTTLMQQMQNQPRQRGGQLSCPLDPQQMLQDQAVLQQTRRLSSSGQPGGSLPVIAHQQEQVPASTTLMQQRQNQRHSRLTDHQRAERQHAAAAAVPTGMGNDNSVDSSLQQSLQKSARQKNESLIDSFVDRHMDMVSKNSTEAAVSDLDSIVYEGEESKGGKDDDAKEEDEDEPNPDNFVIEKIVQVKKRRVDQQLIWQSLVKWEGYPDDVNSWQFREDFEVFHASHLGESTVIVRPQPLTY